MADTAQAELELVADDSRAGFRLHRLEIYNWGTFDQRPYVVPLEGRNGLLTGEIGSGKSTLVDAVTTLLVPPNRVAYNKAAGAEARERSLRTYVLGHFKSERSATSSSSKPVMLRDESQYSVILGTFRNEGYGQTVTLAQVFWFRRADGSPPARLFVGVDADLTITDHFTDVGPQMTDLRKRLRSAGAELWDSYPSYGAWFRRRFGIDNGQALDLFHQTVSMKSVGNLTDFVRSHMLQPFDVDARIDALVEHFDDLNKAHEAVLKAKRQIGLLDPLVADVGRHEAEDRQATELRADQDALESFMRSEKVRLLDHRIELVSTKLDKKRAATAEAEATHQRLQGEVESLKLSIAASGGGRLEQLRAGITSKSADLSRRRDRSNAYDQSLQLLGLEPPVGHDDFVHTTRSLDGIKADIERAEADLTNDHNRCGVTFAQSKQRHDELAQEIADLRERRSNIPSRQMRVRERMCEALSLSVDEVPFVGEHLQVREAAREWEPAAERVLHGFGLSLLVGDEQYRQVADWVDKTHLGDRLVYFRVPAKTTGSPGDLPDVDSLPAKVEIKHDSGFYEWIERELGRRFNYVCCDDHDRFRREKRAITNNGQVKGGGGRHEKDDRHQIGDRRRYVLGWSNQDKIAALDDERLEVEAEMRQLADRLEDIDRARGDNQSKLSAIAAVNTISDFTDLDWRSLVGEIDDLQRQLAEIEASSDVLRELESQLGEVEDRRNQSQRIWGDLRAEVAGLEQEVSSDTEERDDALAALAEPVVEAHRTRFESVAAHVAVQLDGRTPQLRSLRVIESEVRAAIQGAYDAVAARMRRLNEKITGAMSHYCIEYPSETAEVDASIDSADEFRAMLSSLVEDGLPRFEAQFKELLNTNTIREVAGFQSQLARESQIIKERIDQINGSLTQIDYNTGRYIALVAESTADAEVRDFQRELRACTEGTLSGSGDDQYSESKFEQVKAIIERFRGRTGLTDADRRWTAKVTDVRNWYEFSASERWREDHTEHEHYTDSSGKSGGQKEKLAYTILAASLAYQFGLEWGEARSLSFRFVVIDEAFGRGSDESAQYGLQLFDRLNLQLLIVTPLQKIHIIEPFVSSVGFVDNGDGRSSKLRTLTIAEYQAEKARRAG